MAEASESNRTDIESQTAGDISPPSEDHKQQRLSLLMLSALGVVFGDIGTSPIYAFRQALRAASGDNIATHDEIFGLLSLIVWALTIIVTIKYVIFVLRADNQGEGGTLSLMALARASLPNRPTLILGLGLCGAALFFGDAIITPAISVLSAVEGLEVIAPDLTPYVVPVTLAILAVLFAVQRFGTAGVASVFGPVMLVWIVAIGGFGLFHIFDDPTILLALNPFYAVSWLWAQPQIAFVTIGAVFLAVTGAEALYVDLGHFGRRPIVTAWLALVFPCLLLNYFGQAAFVLSHGGKPHNPFFEMLPSQALPFMVALATAATVIASQSVISGAYSLARQAVQLNLLPRIRIQHTSETQQGQIFMPRVNFLLAVGVVLLVLGFGESGALASAYGISVTGEMVVTTLLLPVVMVRLWKWKWFTAVALAAFFLAIDLGFFMANAVKILDGGWVSICVAMVMGVVMATWVRGSRHLFNKTRRNEVPLDFVMAQLSEKPPQLVPGTAVFLTGDLQGTPTALMHSLKHYKVLHEHNIILTVVTASQPVVAAAERVKMERINDRFMRVKLMFGYMEHPHIPGALASCRKQGWKFDIMTTSFFLSRRSLKASPRPEIPAWQVRLFIGLTRTAADATEYFQVPTGRVVEIGTQVAI